MYDKLVKRCKALTDYNGLISDEMIQEAFDCVKEAADVIEELSRDLDSMNEANIALYGALPKWISVEDDLPEVPDGEIFSKGVYVTDGTEISKACIMRDYDGATGWTYAGIGKITHWCEQIQLPEPPKDKS